MVGSGMTSTLLVCALALLAGVVGEDDRGAKVALTNNADVDVDVFWRDETRKAYTLITTLAKGLTQPLNTFKGHKFLISPKGSPVDGQVKPNFVQSRNELVRVHTANR
jgi:hypothetical protein